MRHQRARSLVRRLLDAPHFAGHDERFVFLARTDFAAAAPYLRRRFAGFPTPSDALPKINRKNSRLCGALHRASSPLVLFTRTLRLDGRSSTAIGSSVHRRTIPPYLSRGSLHPTGAPATFFSAHDPEKLQTFRMRSCAKDGSNLRPTAAPTHSSRSRDPKPLPAFAPVPANDACWEAADGREDRGQGDHAPHGPLIFLARWPFAMLRFRSPD
jgi:hypothetical protein